MTQQEAVDVQLTIAAPVEAVYRALTDAAELRHWFAEEAEVSLPHKQYRFWGRYTPEAPARTTKLQTLLAADSNRRLSYGWRLHDRDTTVIIELEEAMPGTNVRLRHEGVRPHHPTNYIMADFWSLSLENLRSWLMCKSDGVFCDFSHIQQGPAVRLEIEIEAPRERVFEALINPAELNRYIARNAEVEPKVNGTYSYGWGNGPVKILELTPAEKLSYEWEYPQEPNTVVTWSLADSGGKTHLTLVHSGFGLTRHNSDYQVGWLHFINRLKVMVEGGPAWQKPEYFEIDYA